MKIDASSISLGSIASGNEASPAAGRSTPAQHAYQRALDRLTEAQKQLTKDAMSGAPQEVLDADRIRVEAAAAALAAAAAALAREQNEAARQEQPESPSAHEGELDVSA